MNDPVEAAAALLRARAHGSVRPGAAVGPLTSYRIGGPAAVYLEAESEQDLDALAAAVAASGLPVLVVGRGSNLLVSDGGFPGIVVRLGAGFRWAHVGGEGEVSAGAAMPLPALAALTLDHGLSGFEFGAAIPGSVGGAVRMNAGAHGSEMRDVLTTIDLYRLGTAARATMPAAQAGLAYRTSTLPADAIVVGAGLRLARGDREQIDQRIREVRDWRRANQPLRFPNGGSVFKNPPGDSAGRLVEQHCGKGLAVGGARVSEMHANFIVAEPSASANDVYTLIRIIQRRVRQEAGIELETELKLIGDFQEVTDGRDVGSG